MNNEPCVSSTTRPALLIIDMQEDFVSPASPHCVAGAAATVPAIRALLDKARQSGWPVFHIIRSHQPDGSDAELFRQPLFQQGKGICVAESSGAAIVAALKPLPEETVIIKTRFSGFYRTNLEDKLHAAGCQILLIAGTQYPNCVRGTAVDGLYRDFQVLVVKEACSAATDAVAQANINDLQCMGIPCISLDQLEEVLSPLAACQERSVSQ